MKVFISSPVKGFEKIRRTCKKELDHLGLDYFISEYEGSYPYGSSTNVCLREVDTCDIFVLLLVKKYGFIIPGFNLSLTEMEFDRAVDKRKPILVYKIEYLDYEERQKIFIKKVEDIKNGRFRGFKIKECKELKKRLACDIVKNQKEADGSISDILNNYITQKMKFFSKTIWPYDIDERSFINIIDIANGDLLDISIDNLQNKVSSSDDCDCLSYIEQQIYNGSMICVGYYGMGKSTISKMLFKKWSTRNDSYPIFLNLSHVHLKDYCGKGLDDRVAVEFERTLSQQINGQSISDYTFIGKDKIHDELNRMITSRKLLLILDGIDESICDQNTIINFIRDLNYRNCLVFLTCRLEFTPFFDAMNTLRNYEADIYIKFTGLRLLDWQKRQWEEYARGLIDKHPDKEELA
ncbi:MAG: DUF4062 domain-containing protein [Methanothrix sp.]|nr:DUF4062 domain-containing protein [Methanothrix sp.]